MRLLQDLVSRQARATPDAIAVVLRNERLTYAELEAQSNRLARLLLERGCQQGDRVAFMIPKSPTAIVSMLAILKADCAYVPIDPSSPAPRIGRILNACEPRMLLATSPAFERLSEILEHDQFRHSLRVGWMDEPPMTPDAWRQEVLSAALSEFPSTRLEYRNAASDAAHILFTSGSTGMPKGVIITHANVVSFVAWGTSYFEMGPDDRNSGHSPLHFDLSTFDIYGTLATGGELYLVPPEANLMPNKLAQFIRDNELTQWFSVPSALNYIAKFDLVRQDDFPSLKRLIWCGEVFPTAPLIYWMERLPHVAFTNLYGPTEATIASSYYTVPSTPVDAREPVPIGRPCDGEDLLVLDESLRRVAPGQIGDLYIQGIGLSPGYWRDAERTAEVFVNYPAVAPDGAAAQAPRIYKTGDLAKVDENGLFHYIGRVDSQIKSRGYRIELGEIETALSTVAEIKETAVVAIDSEGFEGKLICCAYAPRAGMDLTPRQLRTRLAELVPTYMLPTNWAPFEQLPLNLNGKIDRPKLREHFSELQAAAHLATKRTESPTGTEG